MLPNKVRPCWFYCKVKNETLVFQNMFELEIVNKCFLSEFVLFWQFNIDEICESMVYTGFSLMRLSILYCLDIWVPSLWIDWLQYLPYFLLSCLSFNNLTYRTLGKIFLIKRKNINIISRLLSTNIVILNTNWKWNF